MTTVESYTGVNGTIQRSLRIGEHEYATKMKDRSGLNPTAPAWSKWWRSYLRGGRARPERDTAPTLAGIDLFCGCGGLALGIREAATAIGRNLRIRAAVDIDSDALSVFDFNLRPDRTMRKDVTSLVEYQIRGGADNANFAYPPELLDPGLQSLAGRIDLVVAGPPCEGHSNLNNRTRRSDPRNVLYLDAVAMAIALMPRALIIENVPDVINDTRNVVDTACALLQSAGYNTSAKVLSADGMGLPQTRRRFFLVGSKLELVPLSEIGRCLEGRNASDVRWAIEDLEEGGTDPQLDTTAELSGENLRRIDWLFENDAYDLPDHMRPPCHRNGHTYPSVYGRLRWDAAAGTITTGFLTPGRGRFIHPSRRRGLTPHEAARLQGFPDFFQFRRDPSDQPARKSLAKWIGDAVPPILGYAATLSVLPGLLVERS